MIRSLSRIPEPIRTASLLLAVLVGTLPRFAVAASCTAEVGAIAVFAHVPCAGSYSFPDVDQLIIPIDIDEASGTLHVQRQNLPELSIGTQGGPVSLQLAGGTVDGTIDAAGNVWLPNFNVTELFFSNLLSTNPTLSTGWQSVPLNGIEYVSHGSRLDFSTGLLTLEGADILINTPIAGCASVSGVHITCRLDPIPDRTKLPQGLSLKGVSGTVKMGKAESGDVLTLKGRIVLGQAPLDFKKQNLLVRLAGPDGKAIVLLLVRAGELKGRRVLSSRDTDGATIEVVTGHKGVDATSAPFSGSITVATGRKQAALKLRVGGLDLSGLAGPLDTTVTVGPSTVAATATVSGSSKLRKLKYQ
jgi:hypothetical protein